MTAVAGRGAVGTTTGAFLSASVELRMLAEDHRPLHALVRARWRKPVERATPEHSSGTRVLLYDAKHSDRVIPFEEVVVDRITDEQLLWIDVPNLEALPAVAAALGLADETVGTIGEHSSPPAVFVQDRYVHVAVVTPVEGLGHEPHILHCLVGSNWIVTVHGKPIGFLARFDERIRADSDLGKIDAHGFLAAILKEHVTSYLAELRPIEAELDRIDVRSMTGRMNEEALLRELVGTRLLLAKLRRLLEPHRELYVRLAGSEFAVLSGSESTSEFESLGEFLERTLQSIETTREMIIGSFEIYTTWAAHGTNQLMKRLTLASVILLPPTLLAGIMGMNSLPGTLATGGAFWLTTAVMACLALTILTFARLRSWV
jgi:magnesium transporter